MIYKQIFIKLSQASILLPIVFGFLFYRKLNIVFKTLFYFFVFSLLMEIQASVLKQIYHNNMPGLHLFTLIEFCAFSYFFYFYLKEYKYLKIVILVNLIIQITLAFTEAFNHNGIWMPNIISRTYSSFSLVIYSLIFYYCILRRNFEESMHELPYFWLNTGIFIYFTTNLFYFMMINLLIQNAENTGILSLILHACINIIGNLFYAYSFNVIRNR